jgi:hypothetical protein
MPAPTATDGGTGTTASIAFTAQSGATSYTAISTPGSFTGTGASSPITVSGLTTGTAYTFQIAATNAQGMGGYSAASNSVTPITPGVYDSIATSQPTSGTSVTFNSIPQTYKHLIIRAYFNAATSGSARLQFNGDGSNANYSGLWGPYMVGSGSAYADGFATGVYNGIPNQGVSSTTYGEVFMAEIQDYASTTKKKTVQSFYSAPDITSGNFALGQVQGVWNNTAAITSLTIINNTFSAPTIIALYGIGA